MSRLLGTQDTAAWAVAPVDGWLPSVLSIAYNMQMQANAVKRMNSAPRMRWVTASAMAAAALVLAIGSLRRAFDRLVVAMDAAVPEPAFVAVAEIVAAGGGCWLAVGTLCVLLGETPWRGSGSTRRLGRRCVPRCWRAGVLAVVGTGLLTGPALASAAGTQTRPPADQHTHQPRGALAVLDGLVLPDRASGGWHGRSTVVVERGDCLWSLAAAALPRAATDARIARHTQRWYRANAGAIGADPDLLLPGTRLHPPGQPAD